MLQQDRVHWPFAGGNSVDIQRIDAHEPDPATAQPLGQFTGEMGVVLEVLVCSPVPVPARLYQNRAVPHVAFGHRTPIDGAGVADRNPGHDAVEIGQRFQGQGGQIVPVGIPMEGTIDVGAGVADHLDLADVELGSGHVAGARFLSAQIIANHRRRQAPVGRAPVLECVTDVDQPAVDAHRRAERPSGNRHHGARPRTAQARATRWRAPFLVTGSKARSSSLRAPRRASSSDIA